ncbi:hypothetical protein [Streptomyces sp. NPDC047130]
MPTPGRPAAAVRRFVGVLALVMLAVASLIARHDGGRTGAPAPRRRR